MVYMVYTLRSSKHYLFKEECLVSLAIRQGHRNLQTNLIFTFIPSGNLSAIILKLLLIIILLEKPSVTQDQNMYVTENTIIHIDSAALSMWMTDFSDRSMRITDFLSHTCFGPASQTV
jgi:hypothetical protein